MKSERFVSAAVGLRRAVLTVLLLFSAVANPSLFSFHSSVLNAQSIQKGLATYYGKKATGRKTSNGERLHHDSLTCAHRRHPFGTLLRVTHQGNGRQVVVRVTDRGPFGKGRIIDLSWEAARRLDMLRQGVAPVTVEVVPPDSIKH